MKSKLLYPNIQYFELAKELPLCSIGSQVAIYDADGESYLYVNGIQLPINTAIKEPDWFIPITKEEHSARCKNNTIEHFMSLGKSKNEAEILFMNM